MQVDPPTSCVDVVRPIHSYTIESRQTIDGIPLHVLVTCFNDESTHHSMSPCDDGAMDRAPCSTVHIYILVVDPVTALQVL